MKLQATPQFAALLTCAIACNTTLHAEEHQPSATPYRPTVSNPADLSEPGWLEVEFGGQRIQGGSDRRRDSFPALAKLAFSENWGVLLGGELRVRRTDTAGAVYQGGGDTSLILKHRIPSATEGTAWGIEAGYKAPTAKDSIGSGKADYLLNGIFSTDFADNHLDLNLGATRLGAIDSGTGRIQHNWAAALSHSLNDTWGVFGEFSGTHQRGVAVQSQFLAGMSYNFSKRIVFDAGATTGLAAAAQNWSVFAGVTVLLDKLW